VWVQVTLVVVLVVVGVLLVYAGSRAWRSLMDAAGDGADEQSLQDAHLEVIEPEGPVGPDGLVPSPMTSLTPSTGPSRCCTRP
jgi:hypothetical protein